EKRRKRRERVEKIKKRVHGSGGERKKSKRRGRVFRGRGLSWFTRERYPRLKKDLREIDRASSKEIDELNEQEVK
ncbi:MAG: hypothetical protein MI922_11860, partial [Bacteroidales bacterium]|nr:hypothetical protein [Bacteroidales bacterium]